MPSLVFLSPESVYWAVKGSSRPAEKSISLVCQGSQQSQFLGALNGPEFCCQGNCRRLMPCLTRILILVGENKET